MCSKHAQLRYPAERRMAAINPSTAALLGKWMAWLGTMANSYSYLTHAGRSWPLVGILKELVTVTLMQENVVFSVLVLTKLHFHKPHVVYGFTVNFTAIMHLYAISSQPVGSPKLWHTWIPTMTADGRWEQSCTHHNWVKWCNHWNSSVEWHITQQACDGGQDPLPRPAMNLFACFVCIFQWLLRIFILTLVESLQWEGLRRHV